MSRRIRLLEAALIEAQSLAVGNSGRGGLVDDTEGVEASDHTGVLSGGTLGVVKVCGDGEDGLGEGGSPRRRSAQET